MGDEKKREGGPFEALGGPLHDVAVAAIMQSAAEELDRLRALLKVTEWGNEGECWHCTSDGGCHAPDCPAFTPDGEVR